VTRLTLAVELLEEAVVLDGDAFVYYLENKVSVPTAPLRHLYQPPFRSMLNQPAVKDYLNRNGMAAFWRKNRFPDFCLAVGDEDYICE
jgi:hypothetical protein